MATEPLGICIYIRATRLIKEMKTIYRNATNAETFQRMMRTAQSGTYDGLRPDDPYLENCRWWLERYECIAILTRDVGYHSSGWWKNPDYERCYHLSISFPGGMKRKHLEYILKELFHDDRRWLWCEPPYTEAGRQAEVWHYRLFCDPAWQPLKPRGEVYTKEFTEAGWKSFSELHRI